MQHWKQLIRLSDEELSRLDVAEVNLACAADLPDAPRPSQMAECISRLNHYAKCVRHYTDKRMPEFRSKPEVYDHSEGTFRMVCLVTLLARPFGVQYNKAKLPLDVPLETADSFIHGALLGAGGTCASLPVVYTAVGRRLGYPLKLAATLGHLFFRWEDGRERFNLEATGDGMNSHPDDYYRTWPHELPPEVERSSGLLKSMTPQGELADFLGTRGHAWLRFKRDRAAAEAFAWSWTMAPEDRLRKDALTLTLNEWGERLRRREPPGFPPMYFTWPPRRYPEAVPLEVERNILCLEAWENILNTPDMNARWWEPMRQGRIVIPWPTAANVICKPCGGCDIRIQVN